MNIRRASTGPVPSLSKHALSPVEGNSARTVIFGSITYPATLSLSKGGPRLFEYYYALACP